MIDLEAHPDRDELAAAAATVLGDALAEALARPGGATFVATGGTTPGPAYDALARRDLDWARVTVIPSDERFVPVSAAESNEGLIRRRLLVAHAEHAQFLPLRRDGATPEADAAAADAELRRFDLFDAVLLGMGADGHVASLFPGGDDLAARLDPAGEALCVGVDQAGLDPRVPRISLTGAALLRSDLIVILITGDEKRAVIDRVRDDPAYAPPVATLLRQTRVPVRVLWAP